MLFFQKEYTIPRVFHLKISFWGLWLKRNYEKGLQLT
jgi:hypothetical protein